MTWPPDPQQPHNAPPPPYGQPQQPLPQPPSYGGGPQQPYGAPDPYGQPGYGQPGASPFGTYAAWGTRLAAYLIDALIAVGVAIVPIILGVVLIAADADAIGIILYVLGFAAAIGFQIWNFVMKQGTTGYSIGKGLMGIKVVGVNTGQPIGTGSGFVRWLMHAFIDGAICYLGFLWPLWDAQKQTWGDKVASSIVIQAPKP